MTAQRNITGTQYSSIIQRDNVNQFGCPPVLPKQARRCVACTSSIDQLNYISWQLMDFCDHVCALAFQKSLRTTCSLCLGKIQDVVIGKYHLYLENCLALFCTKKCLEKYKSSIKICAYCKRVSPLSTAKDWVQVQFQLNNVSTGVTFCSQGCYKKFGYIMKTLQLEIPIGTKCSVCKMDTPTIAMRYDGTAHSFCGTRCQIAFNFVKLQMGAGECAMCKNYFSRNILDNHVVYDGNSKFCFCSGQCRNIYLLVKKQIVSCNWCQNKNDHFSMLRKYFKSIENHFCCMHCLQLYHSYSVNSGIEPQTGPDIPDMNQNPNLNSKVATKRHLIMKSNKPVDQRNVATMCSVFKKNKSSMARTATSNKESQTDFQSNVLLPFPVPIYVPMPMAMFAVPVPVALPLPIPIPVPVFIPTSRNSLKGIMKEIVTIKDRTPSNLCEVELLKIADILAEHKSSDSDTATVASENEVDINEKLDEAQVDLERVLPDTITQIKINSDVKQPEKKRRRKRHKKQMCVKPKRKSCEYSETNESEVRVKDMRLDYTLGINAWKQWVSKGTSSSNKEFIKSEILQMSPEALNYALCLFVKELRKPNGAEYAPDTIYYLCLGIQYYLDQNGRFENIFVDDVYEKFTECLDGFAKKFCALYDDESRFIITRVEEEHLWETKQLGCYSPHILLNTLIYFNTKYYYRSNVEEHMELSFYHILKGYKKNSKNNCVMLRFFSKSKSPDRRIYEQHENENPLRCPVRLYEYYLTKCPESVKNNYSRMYLTPEKHCVSESPLWYTAQPISSEALAIMINRVKMVKEVNVALLSN